VREQMAAALDLVIQVARVDGGRREVVTVAEVDAAPSGPSDGSPAVSLIADRSGVLALPRRPPRRAGADGPRKEWVA
jgi:hypothetical protein